MTRLAFVALVLLGWAGVAAPQQDPLPGGSRARKERPARASLPAPTEGDLGVPLYPGARFDGEISGGMSSGDWRYWVFFSDDPTSKVLAFYEQKTGKKATSFEKDKYMLSLAGSSLIPDHGVSIETLAGNPLFGNRGKTMFTVARNLAP